MTFEYLKPFRTLSGEIVRMKALLTILGKQYLETEAGYPISVDEVTALSKKEIEELEREPEPIYEES